MGIYSHGHHWPTTCVRSQNCIPAGSPSLIADQTSPNGSVVEHSPHVGESFHLVIGIESRCAYVTTLVTWSTDSTQTQHMWVISKWHTHWVTPLGDFSPHMSESAHSCALTQYYSVFHNPASLWLWLGYFNDY